eukprot:m51a1_g5614 putative phosphatidylinositol- -diphosphate 3-kinase (1334) ;mRNA; f:729197-733986
MFKRLTEGPRVRPTSTMSPRALLGQQRASVGVTPSDVFSSPPSTAREPPPPPPPSYPSSSPSLLRAASKSVDSPMSTTSSPPGSPAWDRMSGFSPLCECAMHGWLERNSKKRWVSLVGDVLCLFRREHDCAHPRGELTRRAEEFLQIGPSTLCGRTSETRFVVRSEVKAIELEAADSDLSWQWTKVIKQSIRNERERQHACEMKGLLCLKKKEYMFALKGSTLTWTHKSDGRAAGTLPLHGCDVETDECTITITGTSESLEITAKDSTEAESWHRALQNALDSSRHIMTSEALRENVAGADIVLIEIPQVTEDLFDVAADTAASPSGAGELWAAESATQTAEEVKRKIAAKLPAAMGGMGSVDPDHLILKAKDMDVYAVPENVKLYQLPFFQLCLRAYSLPRLQLVFKLELKAKGVDVRKLADATETNKLVMKELAHEDLLALLLTRPYFSVLDSCFKRRLEDDEMTTARSRLTRCALEHAAFVPETASRLIDPIMLAIPATSTANELKRVLFHKYSTMNPTFTYARDSSDYFVKVNGIRSYIEGEIPLLSFDYIRQSLNNGVSPIRLTLLSTVTTSPVDKHEYLLVPKMLVQQEIACHEAVTKTVPVSEVKTHYRIKVLELTAVNPDVVEDLVDVTSSTLDVCFYVSAEIYHGVVTIAPQQTTSQVRVVKQLEQSKELPPMVVFFDQWFDFGIEICDLPKACRVGFTMYARYNIGQNAGKEIPIAWVNYQPVAHDGVLRVFNRDLTMWNGGKAKPTATVMENTLDQKPTTLRLSFDEYESVPVFCPPEVVSFSPPPTPRGRTLEEGTLPDDQTKKLLDQIVQQDALMEIHPETKQLLFKYRAYLKTIPKALPKFLLSVNWALGEQVLEAHKLLREWERITYITALELLDWKISDPVVREFAVHHLEELSDTDLSEYLVQLVTVFKCEPYHDCALSRFLLKRALLNEIIIGHQLFWLLKAELRTSVARCGVLLEAYLRGCGNACLGRLREEEEVINRLSGIAGIVKETKKDDRPAVLQYELRKLPIPPRLQLPLFPHFEFCSLDLSRCRHMKSKKVPLWLNFKNSDTDGGSLTVMFKQGDDLRQDALTLQMLRLMDKMWKEEGLDLKLVIYNVVVTALGEGMVEIVMNSETIGAINRQHGGTSAVFRQDVISKWLHAKIPDKDEFEKAVNNFALSCAAYCVATYVLGIGDRHNDNIMIRKDGRLFHIDFGHILGHFKKKMGIKRERAPFIFTPQMAFLLQEGSGEAYRLFLASCTRAFIALRKRADIFIVLFSMTLCAGLPEVNTADDIAFLRERLRLDLGDEEAGQLFLKLVEQSLHTIGTQLMDLIHILAN